MSLMQLLPWTLAAVLGGLSLVWLISLRTRDVSIVDICWGLGFVVIAWLSQRWIAGDSLRAALVVAMVTLWGVRLAAYLAWRNWGQGEDYRYQAMRRHHGERFGLISLGTVFGLQAVLMWIVSLPVQAAIAAPPSPLGLWDLLGLGLWAVGMFFETVGDVQLARFKADPANRGQVMDRGLWAWTRHPNYFGDFCVWWGLGCVALAIGATWTLVGPLLMSVLLMRVSGAALLERGLQKTKPGYADYIARTPAFFPRPPSR